MRALRGACSGLALALVGCGGAPPPPVERVFLAPAEPTVVPSLPNIVTRAGLASAVLVRPAELAETPGFLPAIGAVLTTERLERYRLVTGIDLRRTREVVAVTYGSGSAEWTLYLLRVAEDPAALEGHFRERLTRDEHREADRPDVVRVWGTVGVRTAGFVRLGRDVVGFQEGGDMARGGLRIAALYALGRLHRAPTLFAEGPLVGLRETLGDAPFLYLVTGGADLAVPGAASQLGEVATAWGFAARPSARGTALVSARVTGDFAQESDAAAAELLGLWSGLASSELGRSLGLASPATPPRTFAARDAVGVDVELALPALVAGMLGRAPAP